MTQEIKQLLLADICARLPYGVIVQYKGHNTIIKNKLLTGSDLDCNMEYYKPYLRPMSSMTEEEQKEFVQFHCVKLCPIIIKDMLTLDNESKMFDWLNKNMFDYRGLIPEGNAIEAPKDMYKKKGL